MVKVIDDCRIFEYRQKVENFTNENQIYLSIRDHQYGGGDGDEWEYKLQQLFIKSFCYIS